MWRGGWRFVSLGFGEVSHDEELHDFTYSVFLESILTLPIPKTLLWVRLLLSLAMMSEATLELASLITESPAKQFSALLRRVLAESRLCHVGASIVQKPQSRPPQGRGFHTWVTCVSSFSSRHSLPCTFLFQIATAHAFPTRMLLLFTFGLCSRCPAARRISEQADKNKQQTNKEHA